MSTRSRAPITLAKVAFANAATSAKSIPAPPAPPAPLSTPPASIDADGGASGANDSGANVPPVPSTGAPAADAGVNVGSKVPAPPAVVKIFTVTSEVKMPDTSTLRPGVESKYGFEAMLVGQSVGVAGRTAKELASTVSGANRRYRVEKRNEITGELVTRTVAVPVLDDQGATIRVDSKLVPEMISTKHFIVLDRDPKSDPDGATARIWRDK